MTFVHSTTFTDLNVSKTFFESNGKENSPTKKPETELKEMKSISNISTHKLQSSQKSYWFQSDSLLKCSLFLFFEGEKVLIVQFHVKTKMIIRQNLPVS